MCCCSSYSKAHEYNSGGGLNVENDSYYTVSSPRLLDVFFSLLMSKPSKQAYFNFSMVCLCLVCVFRSSLFILVFFFISAHSFNQHTRLSQTRQFFFIQYIYFSFAKMLNWIYASKSMTHTHLANTQTESFFHKIKSS